MQPKLADRLAFVTANFVAQAGNYQIRPFDWGKCHNKTVETFTLDQMEKLCAMISAAGFHYIDLWIAHAYALARDETSIERFHLMLEKYKLKLIAAGVGLGGTRTNRAAVERDFTTLVRVGVPLLAGSMNKEDVPVIAEWCERYGVRAAIENHPEKRAEEILEKIQGYEKWIGACSDTGWWGTQGANAARETVVLRDHLFHVHLKDVKEVGSHHTCAYGEGIVNIEGVLNVLDKFEYSGFISIEHEPEYVDPMEDVKKSRTLVLNHLGDLGSLKPRMQKVRIAAIGSGGIWNYHAKNLWQIPGVEIVGQCDVNEQQAQATASRFGGKGFASAEQMLDALKPDAVWVCTPQGVRLEPIKACAERGIPVFLEKPPAFDMATAMKIDALLKKSNLLHSVGFMWRYLKIVERAQEILRDHPIPVAQSRFTCGVLLDPAFPPWFLLKERSGGQLLDQAIHIFDLLRYMVGEVRRLQAFGGNTIMGKSPTMTVEDSSVLAIEFASGAVGSHSHSWVVRQAVSEIELFSPTLHLKLDFVANRLSGNLDGKPFEEQSHDDPYLTEAECFIEAVRFRKRDGIKSSYSDAMKTLAVSLAANRSLESARPEQAQLVEGGT
jgi:L-ribulose-5-phosphate 3-epimerase